LHFAQWAEEAGAQVLRKVRVRHICSSTDAGWRLEVDRPTGKESIDCALLIDASGRASFVGRHVGAERSEYDALIGVYAFFRAPTDQNDTRTMVEAARDGWWYSSYLPEAGLIAAFMIDAHSLPRGSRAWHAYWRHQLDATTYTRSRVDEAELVGKIHTIRANSYQMSRVAGENWLAIGDAAMAFDPQSSQGLYRALNSAIEASSVVQQYFAGDRTGFGHYESRQQQRFTRFLDMRSAYYGREMRWRDSAFWQQRAGP
jgi:flavin-dependent dehydrogenase